MKYQLIGAIVLLLIVTHIQTQAQIIDYDGLDTLNSQASVLDQASASFAGTSPQVTLKTYKLKALIGQGYWDLYLFNTLPTLSIGRADSALALSDDIMNQLSGLMNVSLSRMAYFANGGDDINREIKGGILDFRSGIKMLDSYTREVDDSFFLPIFQSTFDMRYMIPLVSPGSRQQNDVNLRNFAIGNLSFRIYGSFMQILNGKLYDEYFTNERGVAPKHSLFTGNAEVNLFISNQIFISAGYALSNQSTLPSRTFFSVSYTGHQ